MSPEYAKRLTLHYFYNGFYVRSESIDASRIVLFMLVCNKRDGYEIFLLMNVEYDDE